LVSNKHQCYLVVDEAHVLVFWFNRRRIRSNVGFARSHFARIMTLGKDCHGAAILGSIELREYLINFARSFIYTTGLFASFCCHRFWLRITFRKTDNLKYYEKTSFISIRKKFVGFKPLLSAANQPYNQPSFQEMKK
jgi:8-amino-7-oxononanoate synthase